LPFIVDLPVKMVIFHSYVSFPEGKSSINGPFSLRLCKTDSWVESIGSTDHSIPMLIGKTHGFSHVTFQPNNPKIIQ
jgi:hypothetical protein